MRSQLGKLFVTSFAVLAVSFKPEISAASLQYVSKPTQGVSISLTSDKSSYHVGDDPVFTLVMRNASGHQVASREIFGTLRAIGPTGDQLSNDPKTPTAGIVSYGGPLARYQQALITVPSKTVGAARQVPLSQYGYSLRSAGTYTFQVTESVLIDATLGLDKDITVWKSGGQLEDVSSNELTITVQ